jgi:hypothetical protein
MHMRRLWFAMAGLALLAGCASSGATPRYVTNFDRIRPGMSKSEVRRLLGWPSLISTQPDGAVHVQYPDPNKSWSAFQQDLDAVFSEGELWQYGRYGLKDWQEPPELLDGAPQSFAVWFDNKGYVTRFRRPQEGPYADPRPLYAPRPESPSELWSGSPLGRDKGQAAPGARP